MAGGNNPLRRLLRWAKVSRDGGDDDLSFPIQQVEFLMKTGKAVVWFPFGYHANVTAGQLAMLFSMQGNAEQSVALPGSPRERPALEPGEVAVFLPSGKGGAIMKLQVDGSILVRSTVHVTVDADATITGDLTVKQNLTVRGNTALVAALTVTGGTALAAVVTSNGKDISDTHTHGPGLYLDSGAGAVTGTSGTPV